MAVTEMDYINSGGGGTTEFMRFYDNPYGNSLPKFMVCTRGYSKIGIQPLIENDRNGVSVYTANQTIPVNPMDLIPSSWGETLLGNATYVDMPETKIDVSAYDYVWLSYDVVGASYQRSMQYRLIA